VKNTVQSKKENKEVSPMELKRFLSDDGINVGYAAVPEDYVVSGGIVSKWQSDYAPMNISMAAVSPDTQIIMVSSSRETYEEYTDPFVRQTVRSLPSTIQTGLRDFTAPYPYLMQYASAVAQTQLTPTATATLPSAYGRDPEGALRAHTAFFRSHTVNINVRIEIANAICSGIMVKYKGVRDGKNIVVLAGVDYEGVEYYDANNGMQQIQSMMNPLGALGGLFGGQTRTQASQAPSGPIPFGRARQYGKRVDCIRWGANRLYAAIMPAEREEEGEQAFAGFVSTLMPDENLQREYDALVDQMYQQRVLEAQGYAQQAQVSRMNLMRSQQRLRETLARNSAEMSDMVMDSWNKKMASDARISSNYSEAIRGVNTYTGLDGRQVEVSVSADHVYQNRYGETFGVSGVAPDAETLNRINWTEIGRS